MPISGVLGGTVRLRTGEVDLGRQRLVGPNGVVPLTTRETELLAYLAERAGEPVPRESLLVDVWHYRASNPTRAVDLAVKRLRGKIEPDPSDPIHILSVHGVGYRFVPVDEPAATPSSPTEPPSYVPAPPPPVATDRTTFIGRTEERFRLRELFAGGARLVTMTGPAGTGKTRLARKFAADYVRDFAGGSAYVDLVEVRSVEGICDAVSRALDLPQGTEPDPSTVGRALADRTAARVLVLLDNFEHLVDHAAATIGAWLDAAPGAVFLVTSRERLHVRGERLLELLPLPPKDALDLLLDRAQGNRTATPMEISDADRDVLRDVVAQLDGIPLAIELAASRLGTLSPSQLLKRLSSRFRLLGDPRGDRPRRHATLEAALDWSWELTTEHERDALMALSVFEGGFSLEAAEEVLDDPSQPDAPWPADIVQSLRDKSLLAMEETLDGDLRYRLLESIREYAQAKLESAEPRPGSDHATADAAVRARHAEYYLREGEDIASKLFRAGGIQRMEELHRERANLVVVARYAPEPSQRMRAVSVLFPVLQARGPLPLLESLLDTSIELGRSQADPDRRLLARLLVDRGFHHFSRDRIGPAIADFEEAMRIAPHHLDGQARAAMGLGRVRADQGRLEEAANDLREAIELYTRLGDRAGEGRARELFAEVLTQQDCIDEAALEYDRALRVLRRVGDRWTEGLLYMNLAGFLLEKRHDPVEAERHGNEALQILGEVGDHRSSVLLLLGFSIALIRMARPKEAFSRLELAQTTARRMGDRTREGQALSVRGWAMGEIGDLETGEQTLRDALLLLAETGDRIQEAVTLRRLAAIHQDQGRFDEAEAELSEAMQELSQRGARIERAVTQLQLGMLRVEQGRHEEARKVLADAIVEARAVLPWAERQAAAVLACSHAETGEHDVAMQWLDKLRAGVVDPRESELVTPVATLVQLVRPGDVSRTTVQRATALTEEVGQGFAERRLAVRLLDRVLSRDATAHG
ncbi:MAG: winged helix-turn-helix domain-containing protein [Alphaproteobacteria bacterium]|nr:winged helix-turn-helix domain-containing protein [Alphaproteobacteria bacterium]MCB9696498.1 winged helix-turn-helix domain-containing protein [Alphaproteobacteria bacterium]